MLDLEIETRPPKLAESGNIAALCMVSLPSLFLSFQQPCGLFRWKLE